VAEAIILDQLSDDDLSVVYDRQLAMVRAAQHALLRVAAEIDRRQAYKVDGAASLRSWLCQRDGEGDRSAHRHAKVAVALADHPELAAGLADGALSVEHVRLLITLGALTGADDATLADTGRRHTVSQLDTACRAARRLRRRRTEDQHRMRDLRWWFDDDGTCHLRGRLDPDQGLQVTQAIGALAENAPVDPDTGTFEPWGARCADALAEICGAADASPAAEHTTVVIHAPLHALTATSTSATATATTGGTGTGNGVSWTGVVLANDTLRRLCCDARLRLTVEDPDGHAVGVGRTSRHVPHWLLAQLRWRDRACRFPGCERTRWLHGHHIRFWADGGRTDLANMTLLCTFHHRQVHEGGWQIRGDPDRDLAFTGPHGRTLTSRPALHLPVPARCRPPTRTRRQRTPPDPCEPGYDRARAPGRPPHHPARSGPDRTPDPAPPTTDVDHTGR
jgi:hypothetical protein